MLTEKSMIELGDLLENKDITAVEIAQEYLDRIVHTDKKLNAYISVENEKLLVAAHEADRRRQDKRQLSKFDGIPVAIKDNICIKNTKTTCASGILRNFVSPYDATSFQKLQQQGLVLLGKTNLDEFAMGSTTETSFFGATKNPHNLEYVPGGSSGGSAAAVAAKMAPVALGSDTGGSIRQPAAFCGVVGIKPTYGRVSRYGLVAFASSLDQIGTFARNVDDAAQLLALITGGDSKDSTSVATDVDFAADMVPDTVKGMRIGIPEEYFQGVNQEIKNSVEAKITTLAQMGAEVEKISLHMTEYAVPIYYLIATAEASSNLARFDGVRYGSRSPNVANLKDLYLKSRSEGFGKEVKRRIMLGTFALSSGYYDAYYLQALKGRTLIIQDFKKAFEKVDAIITPVTPSTAFKLGEKISDPLEMYLSDILTISANLAGIPGISVPIGLDSRNLPIGLQIMGSHFQEKTILQLAKTVESISEPVSASL
jgi:aspartyl-tRNA(Asn)/glutamyl-tRNA(Gln) amidotransferase subunit A